MGKAEEQKSSVLVSYPKAQVCVLTLNRPAKRNALSLDLLTGVCEQLESAAKSASLRVLIINASGPVFCAGMDLSEAADLNKVEQSAHLIARMFKLILAVPYVTIAAVQGAAMGGGAGILSACDLVVAEDDVSICYPETGRGIVPALVAPLLMAVVSKRVANELLLTGQVCDAARSQSLGLVNYITEKKGAYDKALSLAKAIQKNAPQAIVQTKKLISHLSDVSLNEGLEIALEFHKASRHSSEAKEGIDAFSQKRPPSWIEP